MKKLFILLKRIRAKIKKSSYVLIARLKIRRFPKQGLKILFSNHPGWKPGIEKGFRFTPHEITFEEFTPENIRKHDLVVPLFMRDLRYLNEIPQEIADNPIPIPDKNSIALCDDKYVFNQLIMKNGFANFIPKIGGKLAYPYILKKRVDDNGQNCHIISDSSEEQIFKDKIGNPEYFCQEIIPGSSEYATHILFKDGKIVHSLDIEYVFAKDIPIKGKDPAIYTKIGECPYLGLFTSILRIVGFNGLCCFNYKVVDERPYIFEINPRFGRSLCPYFFSFMPYLEPKKFRSADTARVLTKEPCAAHDFASR